jgi:hypothetical protein
MSITMNGRLFVERAGIRPTHRRPTPTVCPGDSQIHSYPVARPLPVALSVRDGFPPPDRSSTQNDPWHLGPEESS